MPILTSPWFEIRATDKIPRSAAPRLYSPLPSFPSHPCRCQEGPGLLHKRLVRARLKTPRGAATRDLAEGRGVSDEPIRSDL